MAGPLVSVIVPTFNRAALLREAIDSVCAQTYPDWELVVVDDGSTDDTARLLAGRAGPRLRVIRTEHSGNPARLRNAGLDLARGEYVAFLDDDDLWEPDKLAVQLPGLQLSGCRWSYTAFSLVDAAGGAFPEQGAPRSAHSGAILEHLLRSEAVVAVPTVVMERALCHGAGGFDEEFLCHEHTDLWIRLAASGPVHMEKRPLARIRVHGGSHYRGDPELVHASWVRVFEKAARMLPDVRLAALCRSLRAKHLEVLARVIAAHGDRRRAIAPLRKAFPRRWSHVAWWKALAVVLLPAHLVSVLRALVAAVRRRPARAPRI